MGESVLSDSNRFQNARISELLDDFTPIERIGYPEFIGFDTAYKLRCPRHDALQEFHERVAEVGGGRLLRSGLRGQTYRAAITFVL